VKSEKMVYDNTDEVLLAEIHSLEGILIDIQQEITTLKERKTEIVRKAAKQVEVENDTDLKSYDGIVSQTDDQAIRESQEKQDWQAKLWSQWSQDVNLEIDDDVQREFGEVLEEINKYME
jgi:hypothetical protein